jgi:hypothetical protein
MIISLFMDWTPRPGSRGTGPRAGAHDQQQDEDVREQRSGTRQKHAHHVSDTA